MPLRHDLIKVFSYNKHQCWILLGYAIVMLAGAYYLSAYCATNRLMSSFEAQDIPAHKQKVPDEMPAHTRPKPKFKKN